MTCSSEYAAQLRALGFRVTSQRLAILHALRHSGSHLTPAQVYRAARRTVPGLTHPTVYRTLGFLARNGLAQSALNARKHLVYQIAEHEHHHLICSSCGSSTQVDHAFIRELYMQLESRSGYALTTGHLTLFGLCPDCQRKAR